ncbi:MAG: hypothetical protein JXA21_12115 [Anaerolineae bacterium]|nr:hypothetical protein [Anaerolineae bacterium]
MLSPTLDVPDDLKKGIAVVDFPLPTPEELGMLLGALIGRLPDGISVTRNGGREIKQIIKPGRCWAQSEIPCD